MSEVEELTERISLAFGFKLEEQLHLPAVEGGDDNGDSDE